MTDLLNKEAFKERVDELYFICNKMEQRIKEFTVKQTELLEKNEKNLRAIQDDITERLQNEAFRFEKARREIVEDRSRSRFATYGLYILGAAILVASVMNIWVSYTDVTNRPGQLNDICLYMAKGKIVAIDPASIVKKDIDGKEVTTAKIIN